MGSSSGSGFHYGVPDPVRPKRRGARSSRETGTDRGERAWRPARAHDLLGLARQRGDPELGNLTRQDTPQGLHALSVELGSGVALELGQRFVF